MMSDIAMGKSSINTLGQTKAACQYEIHTISQCYTQPEGKAAKLKPNLKSHLHPQWSRARARSPFKLTQPFFPCNAVKASSQPYMVT